MNKQAQASSVYQHNLLHAFSLCITVRDCDQTGHWGSGCLFDLTTPSDDDPPPSLQDLFHAAFAPDLQIFQNKVKGSNYKWKLVKYGPADIC